MATYAELYDLASDSALRNKIAVAIVKKAQTYIDLTTPTPDQLTWAEKALGSPRAEAEKIIYYVLAANSTATVGQIQGATDSAIQANVDSAVDALVGGGIV